MTTDLVAQTGPGQKASRVELVAATTTALRRVLAVDDAWLIESERLAEDVARWTRLTEVARPGDLATPGMSGGRGPLGFVGCAPVECEGRRIGVLLVRSRASRVWTERDRLVLRRAARELGDALATIEAQEDCGVERLAGHVAMLPDEVLHLLDHELRTPLAVMLGGLDLLGSGALGQLTEEQRDMVTRLERNAAALLQVARHVTRGGERSDDPEVSGSELLALVVARLRSAT
ncbi:histidine kinase dimerization/phospho-acceptor domain-containing protein [Nocardioides rubriscoriae]|uniref:histidine kinase dimerization/phospho-acceptor domain-containing protein n=1 Tax=Nocardioides rubriscoriae TaxID=642762 RepID=UPI0011DFF346|nr:histidine kinase dimerization/phospho-acceptor domain-containing protein [Nocardioides rubriscoriae]